jgi:hypothetical protein
LHHSVRPFASWVVACNTVHESPAEGAWPCAVPVPATNAIGETAVTIANRSLLMMASPKQLPDSALRNADSTSRYPAKNPQAKDLMRRT